MASITMDYSLQLRIASIFILFCASLLGVVLPLYFSSSDSSGEETAASHKSMAESDGFRITRTFAAGVMLGVGFIHLLNDGVDKLTSVSLDYPSLGFTLATVGAMIVLGFEQIAVMLIGRVDVGSIKLSELKHVEAGRGTDNELEVLGSDTIRGSCDHNHAIDMIAGSDSFSVIVKAYMMEISVAIHSVIIGIALGSLGGPDNIQSLQALLIAICFHQFFEGLGLGTVIKAASLQLGMKKIIIFAVTFALTVPIGVMVGIVVTDDQALIDGPTDSQLYTTGCLNSIAAGN